MSYLHREITADFRLMLATDISISVRLDIEDTDDAVNIARKALFTATVAFKHCLAQATLPADPLAGDEPMVIVEMRYMQCTDGGDVETFTFSVEEIETVTEKNLMTVADDAASKVFKMFTRRAAQMIQEVA